ncbi:MAG: ABC transporter permease [Candidatus Thermoplasmatota archaeon]
MIFRETFRMAVGSLWSHKTRSLLTILGVIIGVSSVLAVVTLGKSFEASVVGEFDDVDNRVVFVTATLKGTENQGPPDAGAFGNIFTSRDQAALEALPGVDRVIPSGDLPTSELRVKGKTLSFRTVSATTSQSDEVRARSSTTYADGGAFADGKAEVVLGDTVAQILGNLTGSKMKAGDTIRVQFPDGTGRDAKVAGILAKSDSLFGSANAQVYVPVDPFYNVKIQSPQTGQQVVVFAGFTVVADSAGKTTQVRDAVKAYIEGPNSDATALLSSETVIEVATSSDIVASISAVFDQVTLFIGAIAVVSLIVGGIGIANIMLVSVTERTREIGVMKAIGARNGDILRLFLLEAIVIGVVGSLIGLGLGLGLGALVVGVLFADSGAAVVIPYEWIGISLAVGILVGVVAGFLPARRATRIQPIQALSYE